jgi:Holliday junction resolvase RusA-like endonuclease
MPSTKFKITFTFKGEPRTKSNAHQFRGKKVFIPAYIRQYEKALKEYARAVMKRRKKRPTKKLVRVKAVYYLGTKRRKDLQNLPKTTMDALNDVVYVDDSQIHEMHIRKRLDRNNPRVTITIEEMSDLSWERG